MSASTRRSELAWIFLAVAMLCTNPALSDKPSWAGGGDKGKPGQPHRDAREGHRKSGAAVTGGAHFAEQHRVIVRGYYDDLYRAGRCPPGLAKKNNGCMPPGQAKKWQVGRSLPRDVVFYDIPPRLVVQLGQPPAGHRYVRVAADILLITIGTGMVVDAIQDLGRM